MKKYKFSIPVHVKYIADESNISIESVDDVEELQNKYDIDLQYIIDEYEYKIEQERDSMEEDDDYCGVSGDDIFNDIINENWDEIVKLLNNDKELEELEENIIEKIYDHVKNDFNTSELIKNSVIELNKNNIFNVSIISMNGYNKQSGEYYINISFDNELSDTELDKVNSWLDTQMNDNWGDDISDTDLSEDINVDNFFVYFTPWTLKKEVKIVA
jgi:hypothetical protein